MRGSPGRRLGGHSYAAHDVRPYVLTRAAAESASVCCYVADPAADARERLRRSMNLRLDGMCEQFIMLRSVGSVDATREIAYIEQRVAAFSRAAAAHGFAFHKADGRGRSAYLDDKLPSAMKLMDACASDTPGLGIAYQRLLSAVTHGKLHGLSRFLMATEAAGRHGSPQVELNVPARTFALDLLAGPLCASTVIERLAWFTGWDTDDMERPVVEMLHTWGRIARVPYPGPDW